MTLASFHPRPTLGLVNTLLSSCFLSLLLMSCASTAPTVEQLDALEHQVRAEHREEYFDLEQRRASGQLTQADYETERARLDHRVRAKVDTMAWSRHQLAQSQRKALGLPTPDQPVLLEAPGIGSINGSLYSSSRINGLGNQIQGNMMRDLGGTNFNDRRAGTIYDAQ
jgi:hypothetical protein